MLTSAAEDPFARVHSLLRQGELSAALGLLCDQDRKQIGDVFRVDRNHAWYCVGDILYRQGRINEAKDAFKKSVRTRSDDVQALMAIGNCYDQLKKPKLAERYFSRALSFCNRRNSGDKRNEILFNLANSLFDQGRMDEAIRTYKKLNRAPLELRRKAKRNLALAVKKRSPPPAAGG